MRRSRFAHAPTALAEALGLIFDLDVSLDAAPRLEHGGWLWVELAAASDYFARDRPAASFVCLPRACPSCRRGRAPGVHAGRLPGLRRTRPKLRRSATSTRFSSRRSASTTAFRRSCTRVSLGADVLDEEGDGARIGRDEGIQLAWDDEDILEGQNRALGKPPEVKTRCWPRAGCSATALTCGPKAARRGPRFRRSWRRSMSAWTSASSWKSVVRGGAERHSGQIWLPAVVRELARRLAGRLDKR